jgi:acyl-CoA synthetase (AMP-forming)/AMP-acid ligase II
MQAQMQADLTSSTDARAHVHVCLPLTQVTSSGVPSGEPTHEQSALHASNMTWRVAALSRSLSYLFQLRPGQIVMLAAVNSGAMLEVLLALCDAGAIASLVNHRWGPAELAAAMALSQPTAVIVDEACWGLVQQALSRQSERVQVAIRQRVVLLGGGKTPGEACSTSSGGTASGGSGSNGDGGAAGSGMLAAKSLADAHALKTESLILQGAQGAPPHSGDGRQGQGPSLQLKAPANGAAIICFTSGTTGVCVCMCVFV